MLRVLKCLEILSLIIGCSMVKSKIKQAYVWGSMGCTTCVICLKGGGDLRCPEDSLQSNRYEVCTSFLKLTDECKALNALPVEVDSKGNGTAKTFHRKRAKWNKSCHLKFASLR